MKKSFDTWKNMYYKRNGVKVLKDYYIKTYKAALLIEKYKASKEHIASKYKFINAFAEDEARRSRENQRNEKRAKKGRCCL